MPEALPVYRFVAQKIMYMPRSGYPFILRASRMYLGAELQARSVRMEF
jgi:hypothetical protein